MKFLFDILKKEPEYTRMLADLESEGPPLAASGLSSVHKTLLIAAMAAHTGRHILAVTPDEATAYNMCADLKALGARAFHLPLRDYSFTVTDGRSKDYEYRRTEALAKLIGGDFDVAVASVEALTTYTVPVGILKKSIIRITGSSVINVADFSAALVAAGYIKTDMTDGRGQFSVRGGIIDLFPINREHPVRIELWGDEIDSLSEYDPITQRRTEAVDAFDICPANEMLCDAPELCERLQELLKSDKKLTDDQKQKLTSDIDRLLSGEAILTDPYIPLLYEKKATVFDYTGDALKVLCETAEINERLKALEDSRNEDIKLMLEDGTLSRKTAGIYMSKGELSGFLSDACFLESFPRASYPVALKGLYHFDFRRIAAFGGDINVLTDDISYMRRLNGTVVILAAEKKAAWILAEELREKGVAATVSFDLKIEAPGVYVTVGALSSGFELPLAKLMLVTNRNIPGEPVKRRRVYKKGQTIGSLDELKRGDYVVHSSYGIGIFDGISQIKKQSVIKDYIKIKYAGTDVLYVPVTQLDMVSKYIGAAEDSGIKLNKLGTQSWSNTKKRVRTAVRDMAKQLIKLYAKRMSTKGYAFGADTDLQNNFERRFEYEETEDQLRCTDEIKRDMERPVPMDRLLCGDVGFGKTEVALRAAFKCISEGKQCALLVPTTILAMQHYNTVISRIGELPVEVKLLNRFVSKKEQTRIIAGLKSGSVDMIIGTHRLISSDVKFKDIGLVIIDEEQRFGVAQKERLKELYPFVDILTLSATPIPRTLNMAMSGLRDMSGIDEAPSDRYPVQTYVLEQNDAVIGEAINRELRRGGQVYYLHNRVDSIVRCAAKVSRMAPAARIGIAHGKMSEDELTDVWKKLIDQQIDILVCTTIIETGVDVPNCNTLIIEGAERMGLAQLHQLRGRVGRSSRRAYAYFCYPKNRAINETARKRLEAIREFTQFGSGIKIALRDLEIRGAGSILGGEQHGNMEAVGYDMYLRMLGDAVKEENGAAIEPQPECTIDLDISAHIPESYINSLPARLGIYKRIADIKTSEDSSDVIDELCDRFGEPPSSVMGLIDIALLRNKAARSGITEIVNTDKGIALKTDSIREEVVDRLAEGFDGRLTFAVTGNPAYIIRRKAGEDPAACVRALGDIL